MKTDIARENALLNQQEYALRQTVLSSYPTFVFLQLDAPCNQDCLFCSRPSEYRYFDLDTFMAKYEQKLYPALTRALKINLTGSGEWLFLPEAAKIMKYFNQFGEAEKMFATNGSSLTPKMTDLLAESGSNYLIHLSMHSCNEKLHGLMTASPNYGIVMENLNYLNSVIEKAGNITLNLIFVATTENIQDLPKFLEFAAQYNVSSVVVYYNFVYRQDQKKLSLFFAKEAARSMFEETARKMESLNAARARKIRLQLPSFFDKQYPLCTEICPEAWSQMMINASGDVITCDFGGDSHENISDKEFMEVWNGSYYRSIREKLVEANGACSKSCLRANPNAVNDIRSHVISRGKDDDEMQKFLEER